jgi:DNA-binding CsgD family transcriptional regulator
MHNSTESQCMTGRNDKRGVAEAALHARFHLTHAEARIALGVARGETLAAIAKAHDISVATARS